MQTDNGKVVQSNLRPIIQLKSKEIFHWLDARQLISVWSWPVSLMARSRRTAINTKQ